MSKIIYSFKITAKGARVSGRICADNMQDATAQACKIISDWGYQDARTNIIQLANQTAAMKKWKAEHDE